MYALTIAGKKEEEEMSCMTIELLVQFVYSILFRLVQRYMCNGYNIQFWLSLHMFAVTKEVSKTIIFFTLLFR